MKSTISYHLKLEEHLAYCLDNICYAYGQKRNYLLNQAVLVYLAYIEWYNTYRDKLPFNAYLDQIDMKQANKYKPR